MRAVAVRSGHQENKRNTAHGIPTSPTQFSSQPLPKSNFSSEETRKVAHKPRGELPCHVMHSELEARSADDHTEHRSEGPCHVEAGNQPAGPRGALC